MDNRIIGASITYERITLYVQNKDGYKFSIPIDRQVNGYGKAGYFVACSGVPAMNEEEFNILPFKEQLITT